MSNEPKDFLELSESYSCLYSLLVKKGVITSDEYINHSKSLKDLILQRLKEMNANDELMELINEAYENIAERAKDHGALWTKNR